MLHYFYTDRKSLSYIMDHPILNIRQHRWLDVVMDYDCEMLYHLGKPNMVANALSRKVVAPLIQDICLRMMVITPLLE